MQDDSSPLKHFTFTATKLNMKLNLFIRVEEFKLVQMESGC